MNKKNKILTFFLVPYFLLVLIVFYIFFGPGIINSYQPFTWKDIKVSIPKGMTMATSEAGGWQVCLLKKMNLSIKIALINGSNVNALPMKIRNVKFQYIPSPGEVYYLTNPKGSYDAVFAHIIPGENKTVYLSVAAPSVFTATRILARIARDCSYNDIPIKAPHPPLPLSYYLTDILLLAGMIIPVLLILILFSLTGKKPAGKYFEGDPIITDESHIYFSHLKKFRRKGTFGYLALTHTRLMVFVFKKPIFMVKLAEELPDIQIQGKKIIIVKEEEKITLRPSLIDKWKTALASYLKEPAS